MRLDFRVVFRALSRPAIFCGFAVVPLQLGSQPSTTERTIVIDALNRSAPVKIVAVSDNGRTYENPMGVHQIIHFRDSSDHWMKTTAVQILNQSSKNIVAIEAIVSLPLGRTIRMPLNNYTYVYIGKIPGRTGLDQDGPFLPTEETPINVLPGVTVDFPLALATRKSLASYAWSPEEKIVKGLNFSVQRIFFTNGVVWAANSYVKADPARPGSILRITREEFDAMKD